MTARDIAFSFFDELVANGGDLYDFTAKEIAKKTGCSYSSVTRWRKAWRTEERSLVTIIRCETCGLIEWDKNPIGEDDECMLCKSQRNGRIIHLNAPSAGHAWG